MLSAKPGCKTKHLHACKKYGAKERAWESKVGNVYFQEPGILRPLYLEVCNNYPEEVLPLSILVIIQDKKKSARLRSWSFLTRRVLLSHGQLFYFASLWVSGGKKSQVWLGTPSEGGGGREKSPYRHRTCKTS